MLLQASRKELDDFFSHASSTAAPNAAAPAVGVGVGVGGGGFGAEDSAALQHERERSADLQSQVDALKEENLRQQDMLRRHQERWQRVRDEYARKKSSQAGGALLEQ